MKKLLILTFFLSNQSFAGLTPIVSEPCYSYPKIKEAHLIEYNTVNNDRTECTLRVNGICEAEVTFENSGYGVIYKYVKQTRIDYYSDFGQLVTSKILKSQMKTTSNVYPTVSEAHSTLRHLISEWIKEEEICPDSYYKD